MTDVVDTDLQHLRVLHRKREARQARVARRRRDRARA